MKILVIGPSWVGDMMMSQSLYRTLRARYPRAIIDVMAPAWCRPLLSRMPEVNEAIPMPLGHGALEIGERRKLGHSLRERRYDRAYVLPNSFKSALVPFFAGIPHRTGWLGEMRYGLLNDARKLDKDAAADGRTLRRSGLRQRRDALRERSAAAAALATAAGA